jgi:pimeloyl-ACP methyl ester carboxylesterase
MSFLPVFKQKERATRLMFRSSFPDEELEKIVPRMQDESFLAYLDMLFLDLPSVKQTAIPLLFIGANQDFLIKPSSIEKNAKQLNASVQLFDGGHNMNLEQGWQLVAERIVDFLMRQQGNKNVDSSYNL